MRLILRANSSRLENLKILGVDGSIRRPICSEEGFLRFRAFSFWFTWEAKVEERGQLGFGGG